MGHKTRKHMSKKHSKGIFTIPELRRSFEHIETYIDNKINEGVSKEQLIKDIRKEWEKVFFKQLDKKSAEALVTGRLSKHRPSRHKTQKRHGGAGAQLANTATPIAGSPLDYVTRQGIYLAPGQIPDKAGHLPLSDGSKSAFGGFVEYVSKGFWNPEPGQSYDPVPGQTRFPTSTPVGMGNNTVHFSAKGGKRQSRRLRRGGSLFSGGPTRLIPSSVPPGILRDAGDIFHGKEVGPSPDQVQRTVDYNIGKVYPKTI
jgi:hypothetical protein